VGVFATTAQGRSPREQLRAETMPAWSPADASSLGVIDVAFAASIASATGALFILANWCCVRSSRRVFFLRLIVFLSLANLLTAASYIMSFVEWRVLGGLTGATRQRYCLTQAFVMLVFEPASVLWTVCIAVTLHHQVVARRSSPERLERWFHLVSWGVPTAVALVLLLARQLGPADADRASWCWVAADGPSPPPVNASVAGSDRAEGAAGSPGAPRTRWLQICVFYLPLAFAFAFNLVTYLRVGRAFRQMAAAGTVDAAKERMVQLRLRLYLLVFVAVWAAPLVHRTLELFRCDPGWLRVLHTVTQCSMGFLNCLVYGCNEATLRPYRSAMSSIRCTLCAGLQLTRLQPRRAPPRARLASGSALDTSLLPPSSSSSSDRAAAAAAAAEVVQPA